MAVRDRNELSRDYSRAAFFLLVSRGFFPSVGNVARAETKFRDLNFDQSLYLLAATSFPILFYALYTLALGTRTRFSRIDRKPSRGLRDSLPRSSKVGFEVACEIARSHERETSRNFHRVGKINFRRTAVDSKPRGLSPYFIIPS